MARNDARKASRTGSLARIRCGLTIETGSKQGQLNTKVSREVGIDHAPKFSANFGEAFVLEGPVAGTFSLGASRFVKGVVL